MPAVDQAWSRRTVLAGGAALAASACVPVEPGRTGQLAARLRIVEANANGALGVAFVDTAMGIATGYGDFARFPHCSSFKLSLAALVLHLDQQGVLDADERITWSQDDLMSVSSFTTDRLQEGASLRELAEFTQKYSDNAAANILLRRLGGPERLTEFWRWAGDDISRLDRTEPELNHVPPGELRDTTTPAAMAKTLARLLYGDLLEEERRTTLKQWMSDTQTGSKRVRAGLPETWRAGDKTGTSLWPGMGSVYVDIGFVEPPERAPITFAAYFRAARQHTRMEPAAQAVLAETGQVLARFAGAV